MVDMGEAGLWTEYNNLETKDKKPSGLDPNTFEYCTYRGIGSTYENAEFALFSYGGSIVTPTFDNYKKLWDTCDHQVIQIKCNIPNATYDVTYNVGLLFTNPDKPKNQMFLYLFEYSEYINDMGQTVSTLLKNGSIPQPQIAKYKILTGDESTHLKFECLFDTSISNYVVHMDTGLIDNEDDRYKEVLCLRGICA